MPRTPSAPGRLTPESQLTSAIRSLRDSGLNDAEIAGRLHLDVELVAFTNMYGTLPARELPVLWQPLPSGPPSMRFDS